jgi:uncharacterized protein involved in type VI secretion and phage assembly
MSIFKAPSLELGDREDGRRIYGVCVAIVTDNKDTDGKYRIKVRYPWLPSGGAGGETSGWARIATFGAGKDRGTYWLPEVNDEVLVAFEHGDIDRPVVVGTMWNSTQTVTLDNKSGKNNKRQFKSRSGHTLTFDDDADNKKEQVVLKTKAGHVLLLDDTDLGKKIQIADDQGNNYVVIDAQNKKITIETKNGDMLLKAKNKIRLECDTLETETKSDTKMKVGSNFEMKASSNFVIRGAGTGDVNSGGVLTIKGSTVNIN